MGSKKEKEGKGSAFIVMLPFLIFLAAVAGNLVWRYVFIPGREWEKYLVIRGHGYGEVSNVRFEESPKALANPNRGFYHLYAYDASKDAKEAIALMENRLRQEEESLVLIEINLKAYREGDISREGLVNLENFFKAACSFDKQLLVRFLYDLEGENLQNEPDSLEVVLRHIRQAGPILSEHSDQIFQIQGLFVGDWGEMHGTKFLSDADLQDLAEQLYQVTDGRIYLAVRTPMQWRHITGINNPSEVVRGDRTLSSRLGLFNDGMLGNESDYGTYADRIEGTKNPSAGRSRADELKFQDTLCQMVPVGGEVINDNSYNDFKNALKDLKSMHVTYLNSGYDKQVLDKWERSAVQEESCFDGMDGLTYVERHLGYRLVIREAELSYDWESDMLDIDVTLQNVGFAPLYRETQINAVLYSKDREKEYACIPVWQGDIRDLAGGNLAEKTLPLHFKASMEGMKEGEIEAYFSIVDTNTKKQILLGNTQEPDEDLGYRIGSLRLGPLEELKGVRGHIPK